MDLMLLAAAFQDAEESSRGGGIIGALFGGVFMIIWLVVLVAVSATSAHLVFALATTAYILIAIQFEEHDLVQSHEEYAEYRRQVPMIIPSVPPGGKPAK